MDPMEETCSDAIFTVVSKNIGRDLMKLGRAMGLKEPTLETIELDEAKWGTEHLAFKIMDTWRKQQLENATTQSLTRILEQIDRKQLARDITAISTQTTPARSYPEEEAVLKLEGNIGPITVKQIQTNLRATYKNFQMRGLPWMKNVHLSLQEHFVQLEIAKEMGDGTHKFKDTLELHQLFKKSKGWFGKRPTRILVEGDAGFGKTTIATKICYDYSTQQDYLKHFHLVLFLSLRKFSGTLEKMLCHAAFVSDEQPAKLTKIINDKSIKTLLVLDGYDELPRQHSGSVLALIRGQLFPRVTVLVTSRPGSSMQVVSMASDVNFSMKSVWDIHTKIVGICDERQTEFVDKHLSNFTNSEKEVIKGHLTQMKEINILTPDFLKCPLFILMIVLLFTEKVTDNLQHLNTRTKLYKHIMNFVVGRYLTRVGKSLVSKADLFCFDVCRKPVYIDLIAQLGEFSLTAVDINNLSFSKEDIFGPESTIDERVLELGILAQSYSVHGFRTNSHYEPVHKSLIEFAAAYFLWTQFLAGHHGQWKSNITKVRPTPGTAGSSLILPFFAGLMGKDAGRVFEALRPFAAEYSSTFDCLVPTLREVEITEELLSSLIFFLPNRWKTYWPYIGLPASALPPDVMSYGLDVGKIEQIVWDLGYPVHFSDDVRVNTLIILVQNDMSPLGESKFKGIECDNLVWDFSRTKGCIGKQLKTLLSLLPSIKFKQISFTFFSSSSSTFLPLIYETATSGMLKDTEIRYVQCHITAETDDLLDMITDLIANGRVAAVWIVLYFQPSQEQLDTLFTSITQSSVLNSFILQYRETARPLTINLSQLFNGGQKSYEWLCMTNVKVQLDATTQTQNSTIALCELPGIDPKESVSSLFQSYQIKSFYGNCANLIDDSYLLHESLTELDLCVDEPFCQLENCSILSTLPNLQLLTLTMMPFQFQPESLDNSILEHAKHLPVLREIRIVEMENNIQCTNCIVKSIARDLKKNAHSTLRHESDPSSSGESLSGQNKLNLQCFSLLSAMNPDLNDPSSTDESNIREIVSICSLLKQALAENELPRLDIVTCWDSLLLYMFKFQPNGFSSIVDVFPATEGFVVQNDCCGMREDDAIEYKMCFNTAAQQISRFSVSLCKDTVAET